MPRAVARRLTLVRAGVRHGGAGPISGIEVPSRHRGARIRNEELDCWSTRGGL